MANSTPITHTVETQQKLVVQGTRTNQECLNYGNIKHYND